MVLCYRWAILSQGLEGGSGLRREGGAFLWESPSKSVVRAASNGHWTWRDHASPINGKGKEARTLTWIQKCTANFRAHSLKMTPEGLEINFIMSLYYDKWNRPDDLRGVRRGHRSIFWFASRGESLFSEVRGPSICMSSPSWVVCLTIRSGGWWLLPSVPGWSGGRPIWTGEDVVMSLLSFNAFIHMFQY